MTQTIQLAHLIDLAPSIAEFRDAVQTGLGQRRKSIPCKFFYDEEGSRLFEAICDTPEYYPTRTEKRILAEAAPEIARLVVPGATVVEYGSGAGVKTRTLLDALNAPAAYVPVEISRARLIEVAAELAADYPGLHIAPVCADYTKPFTLPNVVRDGAAVVGFFPGSTIGNFTPPQALAFLSQARRLLGDNGVMVIGVDLRKHLDTLNAAYNDADGLTAAFNLNLLARVNRELDGDFDLDGFAHRAFFDPDNSRIEMHIVSLKDQTASVSGQSFDFAEDETIHTENSYKYDIDQFRQLADNAGWSPRAVWTDPNELFSIHLLKAD